MPFAGKPGCLGIPVVGKCHFSDFAYRAILLEKGVFTHIPAIAPGDASAMPDGDGYG